MALWGWTRGLLIFLVCAGIWKLLKFVQTTRKHLKAIKTKGIGPSVILFPSQTGFKEIIDFTNTPGNLNQEGFHHMWLGPFLGVLAGTPEAHKFLLTLKSGISKQFLHIVPCLRSWMGNNVVTSDGDVWRRQRSTMNPAFKSDAYRQYYPTFVRMTQKLMNLFEQDTANGKDIHMHNAMQAFTIDTLGLTIFHYDFQCLGGDGSNGYYKAYQDVMHHGLSSLRYLLFPWLEYLPLKSSIDLKAGKAKLTELFEKMINEHQKDLEMKKTGEFDVLTNMLQSFNTGDLSKPELDANLFILFLAGHDTTSAALSWATIELALRPEIQTKLREEITKALGDSEPTLDQITSSDCIPYLDWFINEVLRINPPVPILFSRTLTEDIVYGDMIIPKDTMIGLNLLAIHNDPNVWAEPEKFDPERFSPANSKGRHKFSHIPFSAGLRQCIGMNFSLIEQKLFLIRLLQNFELTTPKNGKLDHERKLDESMNVPLNPYVRLTKRVK